MPSDPQLPEFGGTSIDDIADIRSEDVSKLKALGFSDAEQVVGALAVPGVNDEMKRTVGLGDAAWDDLVQKLQAAVLAPMAAAPPDDLPLGALAPTPETEEEMRNLAMPAIAAEDLPPSVNHVELMSPNRQQGSRGTCVSFALTAVHEYFQRQSGKPATDFSEQFLYHETKMIDGRPDLCGTWQLKAAQVLKDLGQCSEQVWPYNGDPPCNGNGVRPANARDEAARHTLETVILEPRSVSAIKSALAKGCVVGFSIPVYNSWFQSQETRRTGRITMRIGKEPVNGGHAMVLIGYQDHAVSPGGGFFILRNSWFGQWGTQCPFGDGNGTIPYAYISNENWEAVTTPVPSGAQA
jgi:hypothetical protein